MLTGGDDVSDELLTVHADLHRGPVLRQLRGKLQLLVGLQGAMFGEFGHSFLQAVALRASAGFVPFWSRSSCSQR